MGIDCFIEYEGKKTDDGQYTNIFYSNGINGDAGYLTERYFRSDIYATKILFAEAWKSLGQGECRVDSKTLRSRIPETIKAIAERELDIVNHADERHITFDSDYTLYDAVKIKVDEYMKFIAKFQNLEEQGKKPFVYVSF